MDLKVWHQIFLRVRNVGMGFFMLKKVSKGLRDSPIVRVMPGMSKAQLLSPHGPEAILSEALIAPMHF